jgi:hypothetical protein
MYINRARTHARKDNTERRGDVHYAKFAFTAQALLLAMILQNRLLDRLLTMEIKTELRDCHTNTTLQLSC